MWKVAIIGALFWLIGGRNAEACSFIVPKHELDATEQRLDHQPPGQVVATLVSIGRGRAPGPNANSCDDLGTIRIELLRFEDDRTPQEKLGYVVKLAEGTLPEHWLLQDTPYRILPDRDGRLRFTLVWIDGATDEQEPIDFSLVVSAVDLAGNEGPPSLPIRIRHPGGTRNAQ